MRSFVVLPPNGRPHPHTFSPTPTLRYPLSRVRSFVVLSVAALSATQLYPDGVRAVVYTEPDNSSEVVAHACPSDLGARVQRALGGSEAAGTQRRRLQTARPQVACMVRSGALLDDLRDLVESDVLGISSSGFSVLAYYLRSPRRPTLVPVRHVAQFFEVFDGSDGRSVKRQLKRSSHTAEPPQNLLFVAKAIDDLVNATATASEPGDDGQREGSRAVQGVADRLRLMLSD